MHVSLANGLFLSLSSITLNLSLSTSHVIHPLFCSKSQKWPETTQVSAFISCLFLLNVRVLKCESLWLQQLVKHLVWKWWFQSCLTYWAGLSLRWWFSVLIPILRWLDRGSTDPSISRSLVSLPYLYPGAQPRHAPRGFHLPSSGRCSSSRTSCSGEEVFTFCFFNCYFFFFSVSWWFLHFIGYSFFQFLLNLGSKWIFMNIMH